MNTLLIVLLCISPFVFTTFGLFIAGLCQAAAVETPVPEESE